MHVGALREAPLRSSQSGMFADRLAPHPPRAKLRDQRRLYEELVSFGKSRRSASVSCPLSDLSPRYVGKVEHGLTEITDFLSYSFDC